MLFDPNESMKTPEAAELYVLANARLMEYGSLSRGDPRVAALANEAASAQNDFLAAHREMHSVGGAEGGVLLSLLGLFVGNAPLFFSGLSMGARGAEAYAEVQRRYVIAFERNRGAQLTLRDLADQTCDMLVEPGMVSVDLDESWHGLTIPYDLVSLRNTSGRPIDDAVIEVVLVGADGARARNVHFVPAWEPGATLFARYSSGITVGSTVVGRQTATDVQSLMVSVWSRHARSGPLHYQYAGVEETRDVQRHLDQNLKITAQVFDNGIVRYVWSARFWLDGVSALPPCTLTIRFHCGEQVIERTRTVNSWVRGGYVNVIPDSPALPSRPKRVDLIITFPDNACRWEQSFDVGGSR